MWHSRSGCGAAAAGEHDILSKDYQANEAVPALHEAAAEVVTGLRDGFGTVDPQGFLSPAWSENAGILEDAVGLLPGHRPPFAGMERGDQ